MSSILSNIVVRVSLQSDITNAGLDGQISHTPSDQRPLIGTQTGRANVSFNDDLTVNAGVPYDLDFTHLYDPAGANFNSWGHVLNLLVENLSGASSLSLGGGTSGLFTTFPIAIQPGGWQAPVSNVLSGLSVGGTNRVLRIVSSPGSSIARVTAFGRTT